ncbi:uncharacterized protein LOC122024355 isoform X1 [Zingiber officinale]|uniref:Ataxin-10 domain-containing protein n=1 Tax=Zingiber officinale TaxID=94328 RepID=A0A8J5EVS0_ZINOF|nr:uncharacterized protein LOC122024355 isoform X1 [Zingiber officinale]KAG6475044.1 hypothetical protein ZIOFF_064261 [Zingiber officinale]
MATYLGDQEDTVETLEYLLQISKSMAGRDRLNADEGILPGVLRRLSSSPEPLLLPRLLLVRNLCYGDCANQEVFLSAGGLDRVASALIGQASISLDAVRTVLQILANFVASDEANKEAVWARFFPLWFNELSRSRDAAIHNTLCRVLLACCTEGEWRRRLSELLEIERGLPILLNIVATMLRVIQNEAPAPFYFLLGKACVQEAYFTIVFQALSSNNFMDIGRCGVNFTEEQIFLLQILSDCLHTFPRHLETVSKNFALGLLKILIEAYRVISDRSLNESNSKSGPANKALHFSLLILRDMFSWKQSVTATEDPADSFQCEDLVELLLRFLRELEPPITTDDGKMEALLNPKVPLYVNFRKDVVSVICNYLGGRKQVQDEIRKKDGIPLLLQQCIVEESYYPNLREIATLTIRNLLEDNLANQYEVAQLELKEPVITPQIAQMGLKVEIDKDTRRPKLVKEEEKAFC